MTTETYTCIKCRKTPEQLPEYFAEAQREGMTPTEWVAMHEAHSCWGPHSRNKFYCTSCYISAGMPMRRPL